MAAKNSKFKNERSLTSWHLAHNSLFRFARQSGPQSFGTGALLRKSNRVAWAVFIGKSAQEFFAKNARSRISQLQKREVTGDRFLNSEANPNYTWAMRRNRTGRMTSIKGWTWFSKIKNRKCNSDIKLNEKAWKRSAWEFLKIWEEVREI